MRCPVIGRPCKRVLYRNSQRRLNRILVPLRPMSEQLTSSTIPNSSGAIAPNSLSIATDEQKQVVVVEEADETDLDATIQRRRRRHRRRRSLRTEGPERRIRALLLGVVVILLILAVTGLQAGSLFKSLLDQVRPLAHSYGILAGIRNLFRWEILALIIAAVILLYLQPGVEDKVLRRLGIKKDRNNHKR